MSPSWDGVSVVRDCDRVISSASSAFAVTVAAPSVFASLRSQPAVSRRRSATSTVLGVELFDPFGNGGDGGRQRHRCAGFNQGQFHTLAVRPRRPPSAPVVHRRPLPTSMYDGRTSYQLTATSAGLSSSTSNTFAVHAGAASNWASSRSRRAPSSRRRTTSRRSVAELLDPFGNVAKATSNVTRDVRHQSGAIPHPGSTTATGDHRERGVFRSISDLDVTTTGPATSFR